MTFSCYITCFASLDTSLHSIDPVIFEYILCVFMAHPTNPVE
nr:MAG TPA: hypothetical protein [Caudoviricetes sp.]